MEIFWGILFVAENFFFFFNIDFFFLVMFHNGILQR